MISKVPERKAGTPDNFTWLAMYIAAAKDPGEKLDKLWIANCNAGDDLDHLKYACYEVEAIRTQKPDIAEKTYHFIVSFRPGDREKLSAQDIKDIEREFAEALGFGDHQRVAGTHINTDHFHLHVAINKVHPVTLNVRSPFNDYSIRDRVCRRMEKKYGLAVDRGKEQGSRQELSATARDLEARTWQQSFEGHVIENKADMLTAIGGASTWRDMHQALSSFDIGIKRHGAGLVLYHLGGVKAATMKASSLDRSCSLKALQDRLGPYEPAERREQEAAGARPDAPQPRRPYTARPLIRHPGQDRLWRTYSQQKPLPGVAGFLRRNFLSARAWRDYLLADAHKDAMAMAVIITYREFLHSLTKAPVQTSHAPKSIVPALRHWFHELPWETPDTAGLHPDYLEGVGMKIDGDNRVVLPMRDREGQTWALRAIDDRGRTCDMGEAHSAPQGLRHVLDKNRLLAIDTEGGTPAWSGPIVVATDCAAAVRIHKTTGAPVVIAARGNDLKPIAGELRARHPKARITIVSDRHPQAAAKVAQAIGGTATSAEKAIASVTSWWAEVSAAKGHGATVSNRTAEDMGAFVEDALSASDVIAARPITPSGVKEQRNKAATVGHVVTVGRHTAEAMGAIPDDGLSIDDAWTARPQLPQKAGEKAVAVASRGEAAEVAARSVDLLGAFHDLAVSPEDAEALLKPSTPVKTGTVAKGKEMQGADKKLPAESRPERGIKM
jgi:hypothetical protein